MQIEIECKVQKRQDESGKESAMIEVSLKHNSNFKNKFQANGNPDHRTPDLPVVGMPFIVSQQYNMSVVLWNNQVLHFFCFP